MAADAIAFTPASRLADMIRSKQLSAVEVMQATLQRAEKAQAAYNCFITLCPERALKEAAAADAAIAAGSELGGLHGVPFHVKDLVNTAGVRTTFASYLHEHNVPTEDAVCSRPPAQGRRHPDRQDDDTRIRAHALHRGRPVRPHLQRLERGAHLRRIVGRGGRRHRGRRRTVGGRHRCRRLHPHPGCLQRCGRFQTVSRCGAARHGAGAVCQFLQHQSDDTQRRRLRLDAGNHGRRAPQRSLQLRRAAARLHRRRASDRIPQGIAHRLAAVDGQYRHRQPSARVV